MGADELLAGACGMAVSTSVAAPQSLEEEAGQRSEKGGVVIESTLPSPMRQLTVQGKPPRVALMPSRAGKGAKGGAARSTCVAKLRVEEKGSVGWEAPPCTGSSPCTSCTRAAAAGAQASTAGLLHAGSVRLPPGAARVAQAGGMGRGQGPPGRPLRALKVPDPPAPSASIKATRGSAAGRAATGAVSTVRAP